MVNGKVHHEIEEEYHLPNGEREVRKTIKEGDKVEKKVFHLKRGEEVPKEIENGNAELIQKEWLFELCILNQFFYYLNSDRY